MIDLDQFLFSYEIKAVEAAKDIIDVINASGISIEEAARVLNGHSDAWHRSHAEMAAEIVKEGRRREREQKQSTPRTAGRGVRKKKTDMGLTKTELGCTVNGGECPGIYYKQLICPGCKEGKMGYRVRLICDEDTDHEMIL